MWGMHGGYGMLGYGHAGSWLAGGGFFLGIILLGLLIATIVLLVRRASHTGNTHNSSDEPLEILKKRYARGEISEKEFQEMKDRLRG